MDESKLTRRLNHHQAGPFVATHDVSLVESGGANAGRMHRVTGERVTIGRSEEAHIPIDDDMSSRFHAVMTLLPTGYELRDLHSTNGTFVNGAQIEVHALAHGDNIRIGKTVMRYLVEPKTSEQSRIYEI